ncbi:MAG: hypothetical protein G01um101418_462 [Parcubacteria group bacterium Gr01-1014_18]|nr:MAG: hypothetical protein Greene041636_508 [Parcubacteria group bacterium Greene0416_36]TSC81049.1 MAG: hypothetical protein G01um101418_462 [Parcubacteria group bacterium Gr01-1014_18]TSC98783.1 MAG: hypothetical protein Greene101420_533 [Parcubacteria group bacterium Greene1014_20]TSD06737.1 MAG: hypothetical protein Greene07142_658 [Parcubacteria group bacterium Greene0714_2]
MKKISLLALFFIVVFISTEAEDTPLEWAEYQFKLPIPIDYDVDTNTALSLSVSDLIDLGTYELFDDNRWTRSGGILLNLICKTSITFTSHEYGHFRVDKQTRTGPVGFINLDDEEDTIEGTNPIETGTYVIIKKFILGHDYGAALFERKEQKQIFIDNETLVRVLVDAGGLNQEQYNVESLADRLLNKHAHPLNSVLFFMESASTLVYPHNDEVGDIEQYFRDLKKLNISCREDLSTKYAQIGKLFLSGSSISYGLNISQYWWSGDKEIEYVGFRYENIFITWPDFFIYLTSKGPTLKVSSRIQINENFDFLFGLETNSFFSKEGKEFTEAMIGIHTEFSRFEIDLRLYSNLQAGNTVEAYGRVEIYEGISLSGVGRYYNDYTFIRERMSQEIFFNASHDYEFKIFLEYRIAL